MRVSPPPTSLSDIRGDIFLVARIFFSTHYAKMCFSRRVGKQRRKKLQIEMRLRRGRGLCVTHQREKKRGMPHEKMQ
jgi:hypothetical protein